MEVLVQVADNIDERELCLIIYKAGTREFYKYKDLFKDDLEEFQQHCAYLMLKQLKKYDKSKSSLSTYIYTHMPLVLGVWIRQHEAKQMMMENSKLELFSMGKDTELEEEEVESNILVDSYDLKQECIGKEEYDYFRDRLSKYPVVEAKILNDYTFAKLGKELGVSTRMAKYVFYKDLQKLIKNEEKMLKSLYFF
jgi:hypothetical protein